MNNAYNPELAALYNQFNSLQQQLASARQMGNPIVIQNIERDIGIMQQRITIAQSRLQAQQQPQQPQYMYQQPQPPQYMYQQPHQVQQVNPYPPVQFGIPTVNPYELNTAPDTNIGTRYATKPILQSQYQTVQPVVAQKEEAVELEPLPGYEFPYLLLPGLVSNTQVKGNRYSYEISGEAVTLPTLINSQIIKFEDTDGHDGYITENILRHLTLTPNGVSFKSYRATKHLFELDETLGLSLVTDDDIMNDDFEEFIKDINDFITMAPKAKELDKEIIGFLTKYELTYFAANIDKLLTDRFNEVIAGCYSLVGFSIDSFVVDYYELVGVCLTDKSDVNKHSKIKNAFDTTVKYATQLISSLKCVERLHTITDVSHEESDSDTDTTTPYVHVTYDTDVDVIHVSASEIASIIRTNVFKTPMLISDASFGPLHKALTEFKFRYMTVSDKAIQRFGTYFVGKLIIHDELLKLHVYSVYVNRENYVITKD